MALLRAAICPECLDAVVALRKGRLPKRCDRCDRPRVTVHARDPQALATVAWERLGPRSNAVAVKRSVVRAVDSFTETTTDADAAQKKPSTMVSRGELHRKTRRRKSRTPNTKATAFPHEPTHEELVVRVQSPVVGFVCGSCGWILIEAGKPRRKACPKCGVEHMRTYGGDKFGEMVDVLIPAEVGHADPVGDDTFVKARLAFALERFNERKDDWAAAERIARSIDGEPGRALVAHVYRGIRDKARRRLKKKAKANRKRKGGAAHEESQAVREARTSLKTAAKRFRPERREKDAPAWLDLAWKKAEAHEERKKWLRNWLREHPGDA